MKAYYWMRNFSRPEVINLMCYGTKFPHKLTTHQRLTRTYRNYLRRCFDTQFINIYANPEQFFPMQHKAETQIRAAMFLKETDPAFISTLKKFEAWVDKNMDPTMVIHDCRPYSPVNGRFFIFDNDMLNYDNFGYYKPRSIAGRVPKQSGFLYFQDFPHEAAEWSIEKMFYADSQSTDRDDFLNDSSEKKRDQAIQ